MGYQIFCDGPRPRSATTNNRSRFREAHLGARLTEVEVSLTLRSIAVQLVDNPDHVAGRYPELPSGASLAERRLNMTILKSE